MGPALRLRGAHHRRARTTTPSRMDGQQQPPAQVPQGNVRERPGLAPGSPLPPHRQHRLPAPLRRGIGSAGLRRAGPSVLDGHRGGRDGVLPEERLRPRCSSKLRKELAHALQVRAPSGSWPPTCRRCWPTPTGARRARRSSTPESRRRHRAGAATLRGAALPQGESPRRPGGGGADGGAQGAGLRYPHGDQGHHRPDGGHPDPARVPGGGA